MISTEQQKWCSKCFIVVFDRWDLAKKDKRCIMCRMNWQCKNALTYKGEAPKYFKEKDDDKNIK